MYLWIKAAFRHFFNNVQKDPAVQVEGLRACRQLLAYLLREIGIQRQRILDGQPTDDTMLTRLVHFQLGRSLPAAERPQDLDPPPRQRPPHRRERDGHDRRRYRRAGRGHVPRHRLDASAAGGQRQASEHRGLSLRHIRGSTQLARNILGGVRTSPDRAPRCTSTSAKRCGCSRRAKCCCGQLRARGRDDRRQPSDFGGRPRLRCARFGDERRTGTRCLHPRSATRALPPARVGTPHVSRAVRVAGDHRRVDDRRAGTAGSRAARARAPVSASSARAAFRPPAARRSESLCDDVLVEVRGRRFHA